MKKILLCALIAVFLNIIAPKAAFSHPYDEPSKSQTETVGG